MELESEICVVGGGPAGSVVANRLARLGHDVCLVERDGFPRPYRGESLSPVVLSLLQQVGLAQPISDAGFLHCQFHVVDWGGVRHINEIGPHGLIVDRGRFDSILLKGAGDAGVRVFQPASAGLPVHMPGGGWHIVLTKSGVQSRLKTTFLIDCSGRRRFLANRHVRTSPPTLALSGVWRGAERRLFTWTESGREHWCWGSSRSDGAVDATVVVDPRTKRGKTLEDPRARYIDLIQQSSLWPQFLSRASLGELQARSANTYHDADPVGDDFIKVGESALAVDPLSAQGITLAISAALQAAVVVHTLITSSKRAAHVSAAKEFYRQSHFDAATRHRRLAAAKYEREAATRKTKFWCARSNLEKSIHTTSISPRGHVPSNCMVVWAADARVDSVPCLTGDTVELMPALRHPALERPIAYFGGATIGPLLLDSLARRVHPIEIESMLTSWSTRFPPSLCRPFAQWLWERGILQSIA